MTKAEETRREKAIQKQKLMQDPEYVKKLALEEEVRI